MLLIFSWGPETKALTAWTVCEGWEAWGQEWGVQSFVTTSSSCMDDRPDGSLVGTGNSCLHGEVLSSVWPSLDCSHPVRWFKDISVFSLLLWTLTLTSIDYEKLTEWTEGSIYHELLTLLQPLLGKRTVQKSKEQTCTATNKHQEALVSCVLLKVPQWSSTAVHAPV